MNSELFQLYVESGKVKLIEAGSRKAATAGRWRKWGDK